jgi:hypothetical protein
VQPGHWLQWRPLTRHDSHLAQQMVERAAELAHGSHARTRHAAVLVRAGSLLACGINGVPFPGEDHCYCKVGQSGDHDLCRTHAEQRAITLARDGDGWRALQGSKLVYVRLEADDSVRLSCLTSARAAAAWRCLWGWRSGSSPCRMAWSGTPRLTMTGLPS